MRRFALFVSLCAMAAPAAAAAGVPLDTYVGGRAVAHVVKDTGWHLFSRPHDETAYTYSWPGVYFEAQFLGNSVDVKVDDDQNNLYLYVDGVHKLTLTRPGRTTVALNDLGPGRHVVRLEKASETQTSTGTFYGFTVASAGDALPAPRYERSIEFIGDSFTVGYGNASRGQTCTVEDVRDTTDTSQSFAPVTAKHFQAAYRINAYSGRGVVRNYAGIEPGNTLPLLYQYALFDNATRANDEGWTPDAVVIGLGTNDFSTPLAAGEIWATREALRTDFVNSYVAFVKSLRAKWPGPRVILMASTDYENEIADAVSATAETLKSEGETNLDVIAFGNLDYQACHFHPSLKDEAILSQLLIDRIALLPKFGAGAPP